MKRALLLLALAGCGPVDVVIATVPDGGLHLPPMSPCTVNGDCPPDSFCEKPNCAALTGECHRRPLLCSPDAAPVCGCNGVTYWNDCLRSAGGVAASTPGECSTSVACGGPLDCPDPQASCAHLVVSGSSCPPNVPGACWVVPPSCPAGAPVAWRPCGGGACADLCGAIRSGMPQLQASSCP